MGISKDVLIVHCDCNNKGGGVALIVNKNLNPKQIRMNTILEIVAVKISEPIQMIVVSVYRPPSTPIDVFMNHMLEIIAQFQHIPTCIVGDFNEDVSITSNTHCCAMFRSQAFKQMVSKPTHDSGTHHRPCLCLSNNKYNANRCQQTVITVIMISFYVL